MEDTDEMMREIDTALLSMDEYSPDDLMVVVAGSPPGVTGNTNMIHVHPLGEDYRRNTKAESAPEAKPAKKSPASAKKSTLKK